MSAETTPTITTQFRLAKGGQCERVADVLVGLEVVIGRAAHKVLTVRVIMAGNEETAAGAARRFGGDRHLLHRQGVVAARIVRAPVERLTVLAAPPDDQMPLLALRAIGRRVGLVADGLLHRHRQVFETDGRGSRRRQDVNAVLRAREGDVEHAPLLGKGKILFCGKKQGKDRIIRDRVREAIPIPGPAPGPSASPSRAALNARYGRGKVFSATEGIVKPWKMKRGKLSPRATTNWNELLVVG